MGMNVASHPKCGVAIKNKRKTVFSFVLCAFFCTFATYYVIFKDKYERFRA
jgi:hypothetical protein